MEIRIFDNEPDAYGQFLKDVKESPNASSRTWIVTQYERNKAGDVEAGKIHEPGCFAVNKPSPGLQAWTKICFLNSTIGQVNQWFDATESRGAPWIAAPRPEMCSSCKKRLATLAQQ